MIGPDMHATALVFAAALRAQDNLMTMPQRLDFAEEAVRRFYAQGSGKGLP